MRRNVIETVMGAVVLLVAAVFGSGLPRPVEGISEPVAG